MLSTVTSGAALVENYYGEEAPAVLTILRAAIQASPTIGAMGLTTLLNNQGFEAPASKTLHKWKYRIQAELLPQQDALLQEAAAAGLVEDSMEDLVLVEEEITPRREVESHAPVKRAVAPARAFKETKILVLDIETLPAILHQYSLFANYTSPKNMLSPGRMLCWVAKWVGDPTNTSYFVDLRAGEERMLHLIWQLLDEADYTVTWNGNRFDLPKLTGLFARHGLAAPSPSKSIDLMVTARRFGFESKGLDNVARMMGTPRKVEGNGAGGWKQCLGITQDMAGWEVAKRIDTLGTDAWDFEETSEMTRAWREMREYNRGDVLGTEALFFEMLPFIKGLSLFDRGCPHCGHEESSFVGYSETTASRWEIFRCAGCSSVYRRGSSMRRRTIAAKTV